MVTLPFVNEHCVTVSVIMVDLEKNADYFGFNKKGNAAMLLLSCANPICGMLFGVGKFCRSNTC